MYICIYVYMYISDYKHSMNIPLNHHQIGWMLRSNLKAPREWSLRNRCKRRGGEPVGPEKWPYYFGKSVNIYENPWRNGWTSKINLRCEGWWSLINIRSHTEFEFVGFTTLFFEVFLGIGALSPRLACGFRKKYEKQQINSVTQSLHQNCAIGS